MKDTLFICYTHSYTSSIIVRKRNKCTKRIISTNKISDKIAIPKSKNKVPECSCPFHEYKKKGFASPYYK